MRQPLSFCDICKRPRHLLEMTDTMPYPEAQGPTTHPKIKKWCGGECDGITIPLALEIDDLITLAKKTKKPLVKKLAKYVVKRLTRIYKEQVKEIHDLRAKE